MRVADLIAYPTCRFADDLYPVEYGGIWLDQACVWRQRLIVWSIRGTSSRKVTQTSS